MALQAGAGRFCDEAELKSLAARIQLLRTHFPNEGWPILDQNAIASLIQELSEGRSSFSELREAGFMEMLQSKLEGELRQKLDRFAPLSIELTAGRRVRVHYNEGKPPWIESRLQDFFGMKTGPVILGGRIPVTLHLLAPNQRAEQVTADLAGFWARVYPSLRRELGRRYPRHPWPEDPLSAEAIALARPKPRSKH
jgi:ATP-dependent helicase HrpB